MTSLKTAAKETIASLEDWHYIINNSKEFIRQIKIHEEPGLQKHNPLTFSVF